MNAVSAHAMTSRRTFLRAVGWSGLGSLTVSATACRSGSSTVSGAQAFRVLESGGVDGRNFVLEVEATGTALLMSRVVGAGQVPDAMLTRVQTLLGSAAFAREAAESAAAKRNPVTCADGVVVTVEMGQLRVSSDPCGTKGERDRPAFEEVLTLLADLRSGDFTELVRAQIPKPSAVTLARASTDDSFVIEVAADGRGLIRLADGQQVTRRLETPGRDALRLLLARLSSAPGDVCPDPGGYALTVGSTTICGPRGAPEFRSVVRLLEGVFGV